MAKITKSRLKKVEPIEPRDFSNMFASNCNQLSRTQKTKKSSKILDNITDSSDSTIENLNEPSKQWDGPTGPGDRFAILVQEDEIENIYNNIDYLSSKLKNNNLTLAEYRKISDDIDKMKKNVPKKEQELYEAKKN